MEFRRLKKNFGGRGGEGGKKKRSTVGLIEFGIAEELN
jgi:hypothetical protein